MFIFVTIIIKEEIRKLKERNVGGSGNGYRRGGNNVNIVIHV